MLKRTGSAMFIAVRLSLIITFLLSITLCCDLSVIGDLGSCSVYEFPGVILLSFICPHAVNVRVKSVKKQIAFIFVICRFCAALSSMVKKGRFVVILCLLCNPVQLPRW